MVNNIQHQRFVFVQFLFSFHEKVVFLQPQKAVIAQLVERQLPKLQVAGSRPVYRSDEPAN